MILKKRIMKILIRKKRTKFFERLRFKNMLGRFSIETKENKIEKIFREVTEKEEIERIFCDGGESTMCRGSIVKR